MPEPLIDRRLLEKLERLTVRWNKSFHGLVGGRNLSRFSGPGYEFLDHRSFHQGDDLRAVNWRAYMRLEKLFLKLFHTEPRTPIRLLIDASASMTAGEPREAESKFEYARRLAACLVYVALVSHDSVHVQPFHEHLEDPLIASGGRHRFGPISDYLSNLQPGGRASFLQLARLFISATPRPGLLILISDFLDDEDVLRPLQYLSDFGHELMLLQLWTPFDRNPTASGDVTVRDPESGGAIELTLDAKAVEAYTREFDLYSGRIEDLALRSGGRYAGFSTGIPLEEAIFHALEWGGAAPAGRPAS